MVITANVLDASRTSAHKTLIMYKARLSFEQLSRYLTRLIELGLLAYDKKRRLYTITARGLRYLRDYTELEGITQALDAKKMIMLNLLNNNRHDKLGHFE